MNIEHIDIDDVCEAREHNRASDIESDDGIDDDDVGRAVNAGYSPDGC